MSRTLGRPPTQPPSNAEAWVSGASATFIGSSPPQVAPHGVLVGGLGAHVLVQ
jgi:hypothetical protein